MTSATTIRTSNSLVVTNPAKDFKVSMLGSSIPASMLSSPDWLPNLRHVHPTLLHLFPITEVIASQAGRTAKFLANWKLITNDQTILGIVKGWAIPLLETPTQQKVPHSEQSGGTGNGPGGEKHAGQGSHQGGNTQVDSVHEQCIRQPQRGGPISPHHKLEGAKQLCPIPIQFNSIQYIYLS